MKPEKNPMFNSETKKKWIKIMKEKVWSNKNRNNKIAISKTGKKRPDLTIRNKEHNNVWKPNIKDKISRKVTQIWKEPNSPYRTKEKKEKQRQSYIKHIIQYKGNYQPNIGKHEKIILDYIEQNITKFPIIRQYQVNGYFVDGYYLPMNIVFEIDERQKISERDINREQEIKQELNCTFIRIPLWKSI